MKLKKALSVAVAAALSGAFALSGLACGGDETWSMPKNTEKYDIPQDYYRTYYEVFVRSFADGNGDGIGDIKGLINNLDYLNDGDDSTMDDLGINGIWMMPINSSPSYHKYDVTDYYNIDDEYGTLDDFDELVKECNKRNIWLQMDLVLNHTSNQHEWFKAAVTAARAGANPATDSRLTRYEIVKSEIKPTGNWYSIGGAPGYWYLANFDSGMPDVNLANTEVREEIKKIVDFWLERGIHSFRLDAVPWAFANDVMYNEENGEFWTWFNDYCNKKGEDVYGKDGDGIARYCYNVGEVFGNNNSIPDFFGTGMSNFNYAMGGGPNAGFIDATVGWVGYKGSSVVRQLVNIQQTVRQKDENAILSNFLSNHDNDRSSGYFDGNPVKIKKAAGLYLLAPGNPYIYYGEEIGAEGSGRDENKRLAFNWGDDRTVMSPQNQNYAYEQALGTWKDQTNNADSILTYYRYAIQLRNRFPEIARGTINGYAVNVGGALSEMTKLNTDNYVSLNALNESIAAYTLTWNDRQVLIVHNIGESEVTVDVSEYPNCAVVGSLAANGGGVSLDGNSLKLSAGTVAVLKR